QQIKGVFSGVAFSRDPITRQGDAVVIEALPGDASQVVSGRLTPEQYRVFVPTDGVEFPVHGNQTAKWRIPEDQSFPVDVLGMDGEGNIPPRLIQHVAYLVRHIEDRYHGIPQDMEWSYDGHSLWVLQSRPITTLLPIWTRKIAAEVIPGYIRPLTWSINQPLTCGVWGEIFSVVLGSSAEQFDFQQTATLHHSVAYFNASLLGQIFRQMGLPSESLEFLTRGAKFKRPSLASTLKQIPGLWRLLRREWVLVKAFERDRHQHLEPGLVALSHQSSDTRLNTLTDHELGDRIDQILALLQRATYYNILAPLSLALRQGILKPNLTLMDQSQLPEVASLKIIQAIANQIHLLLSPSAQVQENNASLSWDQVIAHLQQSPDGLAILEQLDQFLDTYGYLSQVATDIAVPTWRDDPRPVHNLLLQSLNNMAATTPQANPPSQAQPLATPRKTWKEKAVQRRINLKGQVAQIYDQLLAELRWTVLALEQRWLNRNCLQQRDDIFFLTLDEIQTEIRRESELYGSSFDQTGQSDEGVESLRSSWGDRIQQRRSQWQQHQTHGSPPYLVYGNDPIQGIVAAPKGLQERQHYQGIGASPGQVVGSIVVIETLQSYATLEPGTILVVPYTDAGWAPLLTQASGIITEVGGCLSHGAIVAREYSIPAVMNVANSTQFFKNGQVVHLDGGTGRIAILRDEFKPTR
ncbi:MAG: pyruvate phosphate dikinase PEP/pyruvate-binding protein, partial [Symploca sp. SIO2B6]|nr:pyruvate phosphate dikinase PEP/pyruvate-binding protein [Symploca sp. SIO2B6]